MSGKFKGTKRNRAWAEVVARDGFVCQWCGVRVVQVPPGASGHLPNCAATLDHVVPRGRGGPDTADNLVMCCYRCNQLRAGQTYSPPISSKQIAHLLSGGDLP